MTPAADSSRLSSTTASRAPWAAPSAASRTWPTRAASARTASWWWRAARTVSCRCGRWRWHGMVRGRCAAGQLLLPRLARPGAARQTGVQHMCRPPHAAAQVVAPTSSSYTWRPSPPPGPCSWALHVTLRPGLARCLTPTAGRCCASSSCTSGPCTWPALRRTSCTCCRAAMTSPPGARARNQTLRRPAGRPARRRGGAGGGETTVEECKRGGPPARAGAGRAVLRPPASHPPSCVNHTPHQPTAPWADAANQAGRCGAARAGSPAFTPTPRANTHCSLCPEGPCLCHTCCPARALPWAPLEPPRPALRACRATAVCPAAVRSRYCLEARAPQAVGRGQAAPTCSLAPCRRGLSCCCTFTVLLTASCRGTAGGGT